MGSTGWGITIDAQAILDVGIAFFSQALVPIILLIGGFAVASALLHLVIGALKKAIG